MSDAASFGWSPVVQKRCVLAALVLYAALFCARWPNAVLVSDEASYLNQATLFSKGRATEERLDVAHGTQLGGPASRYPIGTSLLQAPFIWFGGWRCAFLVSLGSLIGMVVILLSWLGELGRPPIFALVPLLFVGTSVQGRLAMSDEPTAFVASLAFWLFSRGERGQRLAWLGSGLFAGLSAAFRDATPLLFAPLYAQALLRREHRSWQLAAGAAIGGIVRLFSARVFFGSALFLRMGGALKFSAVAQNLPLYALLACIALPLGLPSLLAYRGERKLPLCVGVLAFLAVYLSFPLPHEANGWVRDIVLHSRYCTALVPIAVLTLSEWVPRLLLGRPRLRKLLVVVSVAGSVAMSAIVHLYLYSWGTTLSHIASTIYDDTEEGSVLLYNPDGAAKFVLEFLGKRDYIARTHTTPQEVAKLVRRGRRVYATFVDRTDTEFRRQDARQNAAFLTELQERCRIAVVYEAQASAIEHVVIARLLECASAAADDK